MPTLAARVFVNVGGDPICISQNLTLQVGDWVVLARKWSGKISSKNQKCKRSILLRNRSFDSCACNAHRISVCDPC